MNNFIASDHPRLRKSSAVLITALFGLVGSVPGEIRLGNQGAIAAQVETEILHTSNLLLNSEELTDQVFEFTPALLYRNSGGAASIEASAGWVTKRYVSETRFDSEDPFVQFRLTLPEISRGENYQFSWAASFEESNAPSAALLNFNESRKLETMAETRYLWTEYSEIRLGASYRDQDSRTPGASDIETIEVPIALYHRLDEMIRVGLGYRWRSAESKSDFLKIESTDHAFFLGAENLLSDLLRYEIQMGYQFRVFSDDSPFDDEAKPYLRAELTWTPNERTELALEAGSEFSSTVAGQSNQSQYLEIDYRHRFDPKLQGRFGLGYEDTTFSDLQGARKDQEFTFRLGLNYQLIEDRLELSSGIRFSERNSNQAASTYALQEFTLACRAVF